MLRSKIKTSILAIGTIFFAISLISFPEEAFQASLKGLDTWWKIVFPSLLPFFIVSELLIGFGIVRFIGVLLEPFMRPIFRVPGVGGFVWAMGMASGNPAGAKLTVRMRQEKAITRIEGERLVAFTSSANPLFIFGAVAVGFFHNVQLGIILGIAHYTGNIFVGLIMRFYGKEKLEKHDDPSFSLKKAFQTLHETRIKNHKPLGKLLGDSVIHSIHTLLMIGGFIIIFSVINRLLTILQISHLFAHLINGIFTIFSISDLLSVPFISGLFEMTIGIQLISEIRPIDLMQQTVVASFLLAFGGFSVQAQVSSILAQSDIRFLPFFCARLLHGVLAAIITWIIWKPLYEEKLFPNPVIFPVFNWNTGFNFTRYTDLIMNSGPLMTILSLVLYIIIYANRTLKIKK